MPQSRFCFALGTLGLPCFAVRASVIAVVLNLFVGAGVGSTFVGRYVRGFAWFVLQTAFAIGTSRTFGGTGHRFGYGVALASIFIVPMLIGLLSCSDLLGSEHPEKKRWFFVAPIVLCLLVGRWAGLGAVYAADLGNYNVPSLSMWPTFRLGERFVVEKRSYAREVLTDPIGPMSLRGKPLVFPFPEDPSVDYIKRAIGLPGEVLTFQGTSVLINGVPIQSCIVGRTLLPDAPASPASPNADPSSRLGTREPTTLLVETIGALSYLVSYADREGDAPMGPFTVANNEVFVLGDNRRDSYDSRFWNGGAGGGVAIHTVVGEATTATMHVTPREDGSGMAVRFDRWGEPLSQIYVFPELSTIEGGIVSCLERSRKSSP